MNIKPSSDQVKDKSVNSERRPKERYPTPAPTAEWVKIIPIEDNPVFRWDADSH